MISMCKHVGVTAQQEHFKQSALNLTVEDGVTAQQKHFKQSALNPTVEDVDGLTEIRHPNILCQRVYALPKRRFWVQSFDHD